MSDNHVMPLYLLSIRGTLAPATVDAARNVHNETAGAPQSVAAARSLGDLSHNVYVPLNPSDGPDQGFLILDNWNSIEGLGQFFANPQVQEGGGRIFRQRNPLVWMPAAGLISYHFPSPYGKNDRFVGTVQGTVPSRAQAQQVHNELSAKFVNKARMKGNLSHETYYLMNPENPESLEFFAVDVWNDAAGMGEHYQDPEFMGAFSQLFTARPLTDVWTHPAGEWVEW